MLLTLLVNLVVLPVAITFFNDDLSTRWVVFNSVSDTLFVLDLIINFRTGKKHFVQELDMLHVELGLTSEKNYLHNPNFP